MKPLIKYRGGKSKEIPNIIKHIPQFSGRYIEPFFGGGALFFYLEPQKAIINDINSKLMTFYAGVRDNFEALRNELSEIEGIYTNNRKQFEKLKSIIPLSKTICSNSLGVMFLPPLFFATFSSISILIHQPDGTLLFFQF